FFCFGLSHHLLILGCATCFFTCFQKTTVLDKISWRCINHHIHSGNMQDQWSVEVDAESIIPAITPALYPSRLKGQAGKIAVIGGCRAAISALKIGADFSDVFCTKDAAPVIKSYSPELIVHPVQLLCNLPLSVCTFQKSKWMEEDKKIISSKVIAEVNKWIEIFDCLVIGPGLGREPFLLDGLFLVTNYLDLVSGYAVLTPNANEYKRLVEKVLSSEVHDTDAIEQQLSLAKQIGNVTILKKVKSDLISDGDTDVVVAKVISFLEGNCKNGAVLGCIAGSAMVRKAVSLAFSNKKRSPVTVDIIGCLGEK
ncbi:ATP-dependent (S)-NAD(P)H-hydrate dehydratase, partial [Mucuna pruriens]